MQFYPFPLKYSSSIGPIELTQIHHFRHYSLTLQLDETEARNFFDEILPAIVRLALQLPTLIPNAIPLLKHGRSRSVSLSQQQVACLLANAFLCTFPRRNTSTYDSEYGSYPDINFARLFGKRQKDAVHEKVKCIINYFRRVCQKSAFPWGNILVAASLFI